MHGALHWSPTYSARSPASQLARHSLIVPLSLPPASTDRLRQASGVPPNAAELSRSCCRGLRVLMQTAWTATGSCRRDCLAMALVAHMDQRSRAIGGG
jgi:hypothetical protein